MEEECLSRRNTKDSCSLFPFLLSLLYYTRWKELRERMKFHSSLKGNLEKVRTFLSPLIRRKTKLHASDFVAY